MTTRIQTIESFKLNILVFCILLNIAENSLENEKNMFTFFQILQVCVTNILKFGFLIFLIKEYLIFIIRNRPFFIKLKELALLKKIYQGIN